MVVCLRTPQRLKRDNFNLDDYLKRAAMLDVKYGYYDRDDYLAQQPTYIQTREELLERMKKENKKCGQ